MKNMRAAALAAWLAGTGLTLAQDRLPDSIPPQTVVPVSAEIKAEAAAAKPAVPCDAACCEPCCCCQPGVTGWFGVEYLLWDLKDSPLPVALITTGQVTDKVPGGFGQPNTANLFGGAGANDDLGGDLRQGVRVRGGVYDPGTNIGFDGSIFWIETHTDGDRFSSDPCGSPLLARPGFNGLTGAPESSLYGAPCLSVGGLKGKLTSEFWGADANATTGFGCADEFVMVLAGFRYLDLDEELTIDGTRTFLPGIGAVFSNTLAGPGSHTFDRDQWKVENNFYGGQVGVAGTIDLGDVVVWARGVVALGATVQELNIRGGSTVYAPNGAVVANFPAGLLATQGNLGEYETTRFAVVPQAEVTVGYRFTENVLAYAGYDFLYWSSVLRPGEQVNLSVDPRQVPVAPDYDPTLTTPVPVSLNSSDFWVQGFHFGVALTY